MNAGQPPRFVPTLTEVVHDPVDDALPQGGFDGSPAVPAHEADLASWQAAVTAHLRPALASALQACPPPGDASSEPVRQALLGALAQACEDALRRDTGR